MKILRALLMVTLMVPVLWLTGCAGNGNRMANDNMEVAPLECPKEGGPYAFTYTSDMKAKGGGISKISGICGGKCFMQEFSKDANGNVLSASVKEVPCETKVAVAAINPDRVDANLGAVLGATAQVGSAFIQADAIKYGARKQADAIRNAGPSSIFVNNNDSQAVSQQGTEVDIGIDQQTSGCGANCFDPTQ